MGFYISRSLCPFLSEALADKSQEKRSYLLEPLEISTTFIYFAIIIITFFVVFILFFILIDSRERKSKMSITTLCFFSVLPPFFLFL